VSTKSETTRERILEAACGLFAASGFKGTTTQQICERAGANIAAVNYYFQGKLKLYKQVWAHLAEADGVRWRRHTTGLRTDEERLRAFIRIRVEGILSDGPESRFPRLIHWEMGDPTAAHEELVTRHLHPKRRWFMQVVREIVGADIDDRTVHLAGFCIQSPLVHLLEMRARPRPTHPQGHRWPDQTPEALVETLYTFALAGLRELALQRRVGED
jgi:AcrR family transcriptional regulator